MKSRGLWSFALIILCTAVVPNFASASNACSRIFISVRPPLLDPPTNEEVALLQAKADRELSGSLSSVGRLLYNNLQTARTTTSPYSVLSDGEMYAISNFVEWNYQIVNLWLIDKKVSYFNEHRGARERAIKEVTAETRVLTAALDKLPPYIGEVLRGEVLAIHHDPQELELRLAQFKVGKVYVQKTFLSTSASQDADMQKKYGEQQVLLFKIHSLTGKYIAPLSSRKFEEEVLFAPYTRFKVLKIENLKRPSPYDPSYTLDYQVQITLAELP